MEEESLSSDDNEHHKPSTSFKAHNGKQSKKKLKRRRLRKNQTDPDGEEHEELKRKLLKRAAGNHVKHSEADQPPIMRKRTGTAGDFYTIHNPIAFNRLVDRLEETQANKVPKPDGTLIEGPWICALCSFKGYVHSLGGLFGPYYQKLNKDNFWPPFLHQPQSGKKRGPKSPEKDASITTKSQVFTDLWFHGDCLFWACGLLLKGSHITGVEEHIDEYWKQSCIYCGKWGASVACAKKGCSKTFHYACGITKGCLFKEHNFTSWCFVHRKSAPADEN